MPHPYLAPEKGDSVGISRRCLIFIKLELLGCRGVKKNYDNMLSRFHLIPERHGQADGPTDRQTDVHPYQSRFIKSFNDVAVFTARYYA